MQPLNGAYQRVGRARIHLTNLNRRANVFCQENSNSIIGEDTAQTLVIEGREVIGVVRSVTVPLAPQIPPIISILIGEVTYNLRAALDYLIYDLAQLDTGNIVDGTQFPIEDTEHGFRRRRNTFLKGISDEHVAAVKRLQPFDGCDWTGMLKTLSNPDKHRHLIPVRSQFNISPSPLSTEIVPGRTVDMKSSVSISIAFSDRTPAIDTLKQLKLKVSETLDAFKPEFKR